LPSKIETKPSSLVAAFFVFPFDPHDVTRPITRMPDKIMLISFIIVNILMVKSQGLG
jgi:hypothetical protein